MPKPMVLLAFLNQPHLTHLLPPGFPEISGAGKWILAGFFPKLGQVSAFFGICMGIRKYFRRSVL